MRTPYVTSTDAGHGLTVKPGAVVRHARVFVFGSVLGSDGNSLGSRRAAPCSVDPAVT